MAAGGTDHSIANVFENHVLIPIVISVFFSYANFVLMGYFKDISADRASGYNTFVVAYGWNKAAIGSDLFAFVSVLATGWGISMVLLTDMAFSTRWISIPIFLAAIVILIFAQAGIHRINDERAAHRPITNVVRGFLLLHLAEINLMRPSWFVCSLIFYALFELTLKIRPEKGQV
jgi:4-hydroxybenzoate polyprenyltransferase